jgi:hypothetical protein
MQVIFSSHTVHKRMSGTFECYQSLGLAFVYSTIPPDFEIFK